MVSNETQELIYMVADIHQDLNIKYTIFGLVFLYVVLLWFIDKKTDSSTFPRAIFKFFARIYIYVTLFFLPLFTIMLFREYAAISLWTLLLQMYGLVFIIAFVALFIFGWTKVLSFLGIDFNLGDFMQEDKLKGE